MKQPFDPFHVSDRLRDAFVDYLLDTHRIHDGQDALRNKLKETLREPNLFIREPLISSIPAYVHGPTPAELLDRTDSPCFDQKMRALNADEFVLDRPLYAHQVQAIASIQAKHNTVIATGTGSGKTECFLLPILNELIARPAKGVQAVFIYPMNALANDQWRRLRELVGNTDTSVTFGRYTGQTPETRKDKDVTPEDLREVCSNERFTREEIRNDPPQILLTNFAMLEYLFLRPQDQDIFRGGPVRYVVLDEAHSYRGAQGIDVGLLMRRFQSLFTSTIQFILTSATLGDQAKNPRVKDEIANFATGLCGGSFTADDVIFGKTSDPWAERAAPVKLNELQRDCIRRPEALAELLADPGTMAQKLLSPGAGDREAAPVSNLHEALLGLEPMHRVYERLRSGPARVKELAEEAFGVTPDDSTACDNDTMVRWLLSAASLAKPGRHARPLMSVRVHHFFRGLTGACVELESVDGKVQVRELHLQDRDTGDFGNAVMPLSTCVHCGMPVVAVDVNDAGDRWIRPSRIPNEQGLRRLLTWLPLGEEYDDDGAITSSSTTNWAYLTPSGDYSEDKPPGGNTDVIPLTILPGEDGILNTCPNCGGKKGLFPSVLRDMYTGGDAPTALLAEEIIRAMPEENNDKPAGGRQLLAFSDSRQGAAYFMPLLTRTTAEPSYVHSLLTATRQCEEKTGEPTPVQKVIEKALEEMLSRRWVIRRETKDGFDHHDVVLSREMNTRGGREKLRNELAITLYQHLSASAKQRTKMFGMMLLARDVDVDFAWAEAESAAPDLFPKGRENIGRDAVCSMLLSLIRRRAIALWPDGDINHIHIWPDQGNNRVTIYNSGAVTDGRIRWNPFAAKSGDRKNAIKKSEIAAIAQQAMGLDSPDDERVNGVLSGLWTWLTDGILTSCGAGEYQFPADRILLRSRVDWHKCRRCNSPTIHPMGGYCGVCRGVGTLEKMSEDAVKDVRARHQAHRYSRPPLPLVVREHTAQLTHEQAGEYQREFLRGDANVLSSSTTFEMGVDVGSLQSVLLRNVPPSPANYIQRAGRAGRRLDGVAHAVTYARSLPHDQHHFFLPEAIVAGSVHVPVIHTANPKLTQRHVNSFLLGRFLRAHREQLSSDMPKVEAFFGVPGGDGSFLADRFGPWCNDNRDTGDQLLNTIGKFIPQQCPLTPARAVDDAINGFQDARVSGVDNPYKAYKDQEDALRKELDKPDAQRGLGKAIDQVRDLIKQLLHTDLISLLSGQCWLPSFAFPQDIVKLTVRDPNISAGRLRLERDREHGISEYAPGSEVIVDGLSLTCAGLNLEVRKPDIQWFCMDRATRNVRIGRTEDEVRLPSGNQQFFRFIEPKGFTTAQDKPAGKPNVYRLRPPTNSDVFLYKGTEEFTECLDQDLPGVLAGLCSDATLFRANLGKKGLCFLICEQCGRWSEDGARRKPSHKSPYGTTCRGEFKLVALAHIFKTDVLQIRFPGLLNHNVNDARFWRTLTAGVMASACETLGIDPQDMGATYRSCADTGAGGENPAGELVLYDRVPGGAGHTARIRDHLRSVLKATRKRLEECPNSECDLNASCYTCLRSPGNQFHWDDLQRNAPLEWLKRLVEPGQ